jgi:hypothetical protein
MPFHISLTVQMMKMILNNKMMLDWFKGQGFSISGTMSTQTYHDIWSDYIEATMGRRNNL